MPVAAFDTLKYAKHLREAGFSDAQAEAQVAALSEAFQAGIQDLATKGDIKEVRQEIKDVRQEIAQFRLESNNEFALVRQEMKLMESNLRQEMKQMDLTFRGERALIRWMLGAVLSMCVAILVRLFFFR